MKATIQNTIQSATLVILIALGSAGYPTTTAAQTAPSKQPVITSAQAVKQGQQLLTQGKFTEAVQILEQPTADASDKNMNAEKKKLLQQAYAGWVQSLQNSRQLLSTQEDQAQQQIKELKKKIGREQKTLNRATKRVDAGPKKTGKDNHDMTKYNSTAQNAARDRASQARVGVMADTTELNRLTAMHARLTQQIAVLDGQIATAQSRAKVHSE